MFFFRIFENIGISSGFVGCIRKLKIGRYTIKLKETQEMTVVNVNDVKECSDLVKCENGTNLCTCLGEQKFVADIDWKKFTF